MPKRPPSPCMQPGCHEYATKGGRCDAHQRQAWESNAGKSRHERGYGTKWDKLRPAILKRDGYLCQSCKREGITTRATQVDHIVNKAQGGTDEPGNLESICRRCHRAKTQREAQEGKG